MYLSIKSNLFLKKIKLIHMDLRQILFFIGLMFSNPIIPDYGLQFLASLLIGLLLPSFIIDPIDKLVRKIPGVERFVKLLGKNKRIRTIIPRILAGYFFTYLIGWIFLLIGWLSWFEAT
jgi:cellulose synthase/poly-beta-1,6-N-acetylglucosamine synthase-like glycosyltransferase